jgi:hypothetical protein
MRILHDTLKARFEFSLNFSLKLHNELVRQDILNKSFNVGHLCEGDFLVGFCFDLDDFVAFIAHKSANVLEALANSLLEDCVFTWISLVTGEEIDELVIGNATEASILALLILEEGE